MKRSRETYDYDFSYELYPGRVRDVTSRGRWVRDFDNGRRFLRWRYYYLGIRVPWLAWAMFA